MSKSPSLAIVIPVWNLPAELTALLHSVGALGIFDQVIVADDASDPACEPRKLGLRKSHVKAPLTYVRSDVQRGAGAARNSGLEAVTTDFVLFFDADDEIDPGLKDIWHELTSYMATPEGAALDFAMFRHADTRVNSRRASFPTDEAIWNAALKGRSSAKLTVSEQAQLVAISAYPWNKFYRTDFLRKHEIRCSETPVHNDLALHWKSFLHARHIWASAEIGAVHVVEEVGRHHLTNRRGEERFCVFEIFADILATIRANPSHHILYVARFLSFAYDLCAWIYGRIAPELAEAFLDRTRHFMTEAVTVQEFSAFSIWRPRKADRVVDLIQGLRGL